MNQPANSTPTTKVIVHIAKWTLLVFYTIISGMLIASLIDISKSYDDVDGITTFGVVVILTPFILLAFILFRKPYLGLLIGTIIFILFSIISLLPIFQSGIETGLIMSSIYTTCIVILILATRKAKQLRNTK